MNRNEDEQYLKDNYRVIELDKEFVIDYINKSILLLESIFIVRNNTV